MSNDSSLGCLVICCYRILTFPNYKDLGSDLILLPRWRLSRARVSGCYIDAPQGYQSLTAKGKVTLCQDQRPAIMSIQEVEGLGIFLSPPKIMLLKWVTFHQSSRLGSFSSVIEGWLVIEGQLSRWLPGRLLMLKDRGEIVGLGHQGWTLDIGPSTCTILILVRRTIIDRVFRYGWYGTMNIFGRAEREVEVEEERKVTPF